MSLLGELRQEVEKIREEEQRQHVELVDQEAFYQEQLKPEMLRANTYFSELVENLNIIQPDVFASYPFDPTITDGLKLRQSDYQFWYDSGTNPRQIDVTCKCHLVRPHEFYVPTKKAVLRHADVLADFDFPHHRKNKLDQLYDICGATFILEGPLKVHLRVYASAEDRCIYVILRNLYAHKSLKRYKFSPEAVDESLLEKIAKLLLREEIELVENRVSDEVRAQLRLQIEADKDHKESLIAEHYAEIEQEKLAREQASLKSRLKHSIRSRFASE